MVTVTPPNRIEAPAEWNTPDVTGSQVSTLAAAGERVRRALVLLGVFLFALAVTATTLHGPDLRTVEVQFVGDAALLTPGSPTSPSAATD